MRPLTRLTVPAAAAFATLLMGCGALFGVDFGDAHAIDETDAATLDGATTPETDKGDDHRRRRGRGSRFGRRTRRPRALGHVDRLRPESVRRRRCADRSVTLTNMGGAPVAFNVALTSMVAFSLVGSPSGMLPAGAAVTLAVHPHAMLASARAGDVLETMLVVSGDGRAQPSQSSPCR